MITCFLEGGGGGRGGGGGLSQCHETVLFAHYCGNFVFSVNSNADAYECFFQNVYATHSQIRVVLRWDRALQFTPVTVLNVDEKEKHNC